jgi:hypothetical protein
MIKLGLILAIIIAVLGGGTVAYRTAYSNGFNEAQRLNAIENEQSRISTQATINTIEQQALEKIASQTASNVEKVIADVRKTNPSCSLVVPAVVRDALKRR